MIGMAGCTPSWNIFHQYTPVSLKSCREDPRFSVLVCFFFCQKMRFYVALQVYCCYWFTKLTSCSPKDVATCFKILVKYLNGWLAGKSFEMTAGANGSRTVGAKWRGSKFNGRTAASQCDDLFSATAVEPPQLGLDRQPQS